MFFVVVLWEEIWFGEVQSNTLRLPGGRGSNRKNSPGKEESKEGRNGMALFQLPKINMMAPVCGVTCLQRHLSYWIPDGYTAGLGVINLASCVGSASMWQHFSTPQHKTPIKGKKNIIAIRWNQTETHFSCHFCCSHCVLQFKKEQFRRNCEWVTCKTASTNTSSVPKTSELPIKTAF